MDGYARLMIEVAPRQLGPGLTTPFSVFRVSGTTSPMAPVICLLDANSSDASGRAVGVNTAEKNPSHGRVELCLTLVWNGFGKPKQILERST